MGEEWESVEKRRGGGRGGEEEEGEEEEEEEESCCSSLDLCLPAGRRSRRVDGRTCHYTTATPEDLSLFIPCAVARTSRVLMDVCAAPLS